MSELLRLTWSDREMDVDAADSQDLADAVLYCALDHSYDRPDDGLPMGLPDDLRARLLPVVADHMSRKCADWPSKTIDMDDDEQTAFLADLLRAITERP